MLPRIEPLRLSGGSFNVINQDKYQQALNLLREAIFDQGATLFAADNLITWNRNLSFLRDPFFMDQLSGDTGLTLIEKSTVWRRYLLLYFAQFATRAEGDFLELGCHTGLTASQVVQRIDFEALGKAYWLYDLFGWQPGDQHTRMEGHLNDQMHEDVQRLFAPHAFVRVIKGSVPESFEQGFPEVIAFAHIDMNHPVAEAGALVHVLPRLSSGGAVVFDDYGWWTYSSQKTALDPIAASHGLEILELPTGQGLLLKP